MASDRPGRTTAISPLAVALYGRCPRCGRGQLFDGFLAIRAACASCKLDFSFADTADGPAVFVMLIVGFIVVGGALAVEILYQPSYWLHAALWLPLAVLLSLIMLRPTKALLFAQQYRHDAEEGKISKD